MASFVDQEITRIRNLVGPKGQVLGAVSGGVDSTVAAKLMHEAIGDRFKAVLVDHGFMRLGEREQVQKDLSVRIPPRILVIKGLSWRRSTLILTSPLWTRLAHSIRA